MKINKKFILMLIFGCATILPFVVSAQEFPIPKWHLNPDEIGPSTLGYLIVQTASFATRVVGILAIVLLLYSGLKRITSAGSSESTGEADEIMWAALIGMMIAFVSVLGLQLINPVDLVTFQPITLTKITKDEKPAKVEVSITQESESERGTPGGPALATPFTGPLSPDFAKLRGRGLRFADQNTNDRDGLPTGQITSTNREVIRRLPGGVVRLDPRIAAFYNAALDDPNVKNIPRTGSLVGGHRYDNGGDGVSPHINGLGIDMENDEAFVRWAYTNRVRLGISQIITKKFPQYNFGHNRDPDLLDDHITHTHFSFHPTPVR